MNYDILTLMTPPSRMQEGIFSGEQEDAARKAGDDAVAKAKAERAESIKTARDADKKAKADSKAAATAQKEQIKALRTKVQTAMKNFNTYYKTANLGKYGKTVQKLSSKVYTNYKKIITCIVIASVVILVAVLGAAAIPKLVKAGIKAKDNPEEAVKELDVIDKSSTGTATTPQTDPTGNAAVPVDPTLTGNTAPLESTSPAGTADGAMATAAAGAATTGIVGASNKVATETSTVAAEKTPQEMNDAELVNARNAEPDVAKRDALQAEINNRNSDGKKHIWTDADNKLAAQRKQAVEEYAAKQAAAQKPAVAPTADVAPEKTLSQADIGAVPENPPAVKTIPATDPSAGGTSNALATPQAPAPQIDPEAAAKASSERANKLRYDSNFQAAMKDGLDDDDIRRFTAIGYSEDDIKNAMRQHNQSYSSDSPYYWGDNSTSPEQKAKQEAEAQRKQAAQQAIIQKNMNKANVALQTMKAGKFGSGPLGQQQSQIYSLLANRVDSGNNTITLADYNTLVANGAIKDSQIGMNTLQNSVADINRYLKTLNKPELVVDFSQR